jgi:hypothetical protein
MQEAVEVELIQLKLLAVLAVQVEVVLVVKVQH